MTLYTPQSASARIFHIDGPSLYSAAKDFFREIGDNIKIENSAVKTLLRKVSAGCGDHYVFRLLSMFPGAGEELAVDYSRMAVVSAATSHDRAAALANLAADFVLAGDLRSARPLLDKSLSLAETPGGYLNLATVLWLERDVQAADALLLECLGRGETYRENVLDAAFNPQNNLSMLPAAAALRMEEGGPFNFSRN